MANNQKFKQRRVNTLPTTGLVAGDLYSLNVGGGKYKNFIVSDSLNLTGEAGAEFLEKDTMQEMRNLSSREIWALQNNIYKGVKLNGYYEKGDTPAPIEYYISETADSDDGGSVIEVLGNKLEHKFIGNVNPLYFGVADNVDNSTYLQNVIDYASTSGLYINFPEERRFISNSQLHIKDNTLINGNNTTLYRTLQTKDSSFFYGEDINNLIYTSLNLEGITTAVTNEWYHTNNSGIRVVRGKDIEVFNSQISRMSSAFQLYYGDKATIGDCKINNNILTGISGMNHRVKVYGCEFRDNGMIYQTGLTHDIYFINSIDVNIYDNDFYSHVDPVSYHVVFKWDSREVTANYDEARKAIIASNRFYTYNPSIDVISSSHTGAEGMTKPVSDVLVENNIGENGVIRFVSVINGKSRNNITGVLNSRSGIGVTTGFNMELESINDDVKNITLSSINAVAEIDTKNIRFINTNFRDEIPLVYDAGNGGQPAFTLNNPILLPEANLSLMDSQVFGAIRSGRGVINSSKSMYDFVRNLNVIETSTVYTPDNRRSDNKYFYYSLISTAITINNPIENIAGTNIRIAIKKTGAPNYMPVTLGNKYILTQKTKELLNTNINPSLLVIDFLSIDNLWYEVNCNGWAGRSEIQKDPTFKNIINRTSSQGVQPIDGVIKITTNGVFNLPSTSSIVGRELILTKDVAGVVTITPFAGDTISGNTEYRIENVNEYVVLIADIGNWRVLSNNRPSTISQLGLVKQSATSADTATAPSATYTQAEVTAILTELRDLKTKLRTAGILAT